MGLPGELLLVITVLLTLAIFASGFRFARRLTGRGWISNSLDASLLTFLVEYLAVTLPGVVGVLSPASMCVVALAICVAIWFFTPVSNQPDGHAIASRLAGLDVVPVACMFFVAGFLAGIIWIGRYSPVLGDDALTYHLPAAVQWLRDGRIGLYTTWFFNPANTYSPLAGSAFMAWLIGPMANDLLARWVQAPALVMIFFGLIELARTVGVRTSVAAIIAAGAVLSRPFVSQSFEVKDDLFLAAFFLAAVVGCSRQAIADPLGPSRIGIALGLFFAVKYTAILTAPLFVLLIDAPIRAHWNRRKWLIAMATMFLLAGPWYVRNWIVAGNPLYPIPIGHLFPGLFIAARSTDMSSLSGIWTSLTGKFHSVSTGLLTVLTAGWLAATALSIRRIAREPTLRMCTVGSLAGVLIFILASHAAEIRYMYPAMLLMFVCCGMAITSAVSVVTSLPTRRRATSDHVAIGFAHAIALSLAGLCIAGAFVDPGIVGFLVACATGGAIIGWFLVLAWQRFLSTRPAARIGAGVVLLLALAGVMFVYWPGYVEQNRLDYNIVNARIHGASGELWEWVNLNLPADARIAYTNMFMIHALGGFDQARVLAYAPTRPGLRAYHDLPPSREVISDQQIRGWVADQLTAGASSETWKANLAKIRPQFLIVGKQDVLPEPPERRFADEDANHFERVFENAAGAIYRVDRK